MLETYYKYRMEYKDFLLFIKIDRIYEELNNNFESNLDVTFLFLKLKSIKIIFINILIKVIL